MLHMLYRLAGPLQPELDTYCEFLEEALVSKQSLSKARTNLNPAFVHKFADDCQKSTRRIATRPSGMEYI